MHSASIYEAFSEPLHQAGLYVSRSGPDSDLTIRVYRTSSDNEALAALSVTEPEYIGVLLANGEEYWENVWSPEERASLATEMAAIVLKYAKDRIVEKSLVRALGLKRSRASYERRRSIL